MGMDNVSDKVNINVGEGGGGGGAGGLAAVIAALGNRNQGNDNAALIAALGNRNDDSSNLMPLMGMMAGGGGFGGNNMNALWPIILLALLGRGRGGGLFGGGDDCGGGAEAALLQTLMEGQSNLRAQVPTTALETQNAVLGAISQLALGTQQGLGNVKDAVQNGFALTSRDLAAVNQNVSAQGCQTREVVLAAENRIITKLDQNTIDDLRDRVRRNEHAVEVQSLRSQVEVNQTVTQTQAQAQGQAQFQIQFQDIANRLARLCDRVDIVHQEARATNANIIAGNAGAVTTGAQTSNPTNVNAR